MSHLLFGESDGNMKLVSPIDSVVWAAGKVESELDYIFLDSLVSLITASLRFYRVLSSDSKT